jgi:tetratricopeptide (TPR) repeat protein
MSDDGAELERLDAVIAENDALSTPKARWRAADALYQKAELVESRDGPEAALRLYADVARRLEGVQDPGPREMLICALQVVADLHDDLGNAAESRSVAEALIRDHFEDPPAEAVGVVVSAALLLGKLRAEAGEHDRAVELLDGLIERYGEAAGPMRVAMANKNAGLALGSAGRLDDSIVRYGRAIELLSDPEDLRARQLLADAMARQAYYLYEVERPEDAASRCRELIDRFAAELDPEIADSVAWAREMLDHEKQSERKRFRFRR